jgi:2-polyprenyl-6-methoxyphenol hydroxylase-like FAD-dependent oxidoreductase
VTVLERWPEPYPLPRAVHFDHEVGRILQACGIGDELRAISEPADVYEWRNAGGTTLLRFGQAGDGPSGWPASSMFNQPMLEALLDRRARQVGVDVRRGTEVSGLTQRDDRVLVTGADGSQLSSRYVVGCDGANSTVRALTGLPVTDLGYFYDWLIVDVVLDEPRIFDPINVQICDPSRPTTVVSGGPGRRRWEFMRLPSESLDELNVETRAWELLEPWDVTRTNARLERHAVYTFNARCADAWRLKRVFLAGDAAHLMPPFAGQGMCAGLRDAVNLSWKLHLVLQGIAAESLLETYEAERMPSVRAAIDLSVELGKVICVPDRAEAARRDEAMAAGVRDEPAAAPGLPGIESGFVQPTSRHAGSQFVQGLEAGRRFDELFGNGWRMVSLGAEAEELGEGARAWFESIGGRAVVLADPDSLFRDWFREHDATWALQRPDFYLYGTAPGSVAATALLESLRQHLEKGSPT